MNKEYYVYCAYGINGEVLYVGKGSGDRYKHCNSGMSSNKRLNKYCFQNGGDSSMTVKVIHSDLSDSEAKAKECECIKTLKPLFNVVGVSGCRYISADDVVKYENLIQYCLAKEIPDWTVEHHLKVTKKLIKDGDKIIANPKFIQHTQ